MYNSELETMGNINKNERRCAYPQKVYERLGEGETERVRERSNWNRTVGGSKEAFKQIVKNIKLQGIIAGIKVEMDFRWYFT